LFFFFSANTTIDAVYDLLEEQDVVAFIGPHSSGVVAAFHHAVAQVHAIPTISPAATLAQLSNPLEYPFFLRTLPGGAGPTADAIVG